MLFGLLVTTFAASGPLVIGVDETLQRRRGAKIAAKGIYRDAVRSSHAHFVKASMLRWICLMLLVPIPWADRVWALPFLTALAPSERANAAAERRHKTPTDWARQLLRGGAALVPPAGKRRSGGQRLCGPLTARTLRRAPPARHGDRMGDRA